MKLLFTLLTIVVILVIFITLATHKTADSNITTYSQQNFDYELTDIEITNSENQAITVKAEVADTGAKRTKGLMFRESLEENMGMIFIFPMASNYKFWMANTLIPLDIIWINENFEITYINKDTPPCTKTGKAQSYCTSYGPSNNKDKYILEVNAGFTEKNKIEVGNTIKFLNNQLQ